MEHDSHTLGFILQSATSTDNGSIIGHVRRIGVRKAFEEEKRGFSAIVLVQFSRATVEKDFRRGELVVGGGLSIMQDVSNEIVNDYFGGLDDAERTAWNRYVVTGRTNG